MSESKEDANTGRSLEPDSDPFQSEQPDFVIIMIPDVMTSRPPQHTDDVKYKNACRALQKMIDESPHRRFEVQDVVKIAQKTLLEQQKQSRRSVMAAKVELVNSTNFQLEHIRHIVIDFAREDFVKALTEKWCVKHMYFVAVHRNDYERRARELQQVM